jgi:hypothetical protein
MCYTDYVPKQNLTLTVEEDLLLAARKIALDRRTSVNQLVREFLLSLVEMSGRRRIARACLEEISERGVVEIGEKTWTRDSLYER